jgi:hypothetical protein
MEFFKNTLLFHNGTVQPGCDASTPPYPDTSTAYDGVRGYDTSMCARVRGC